MHLGLLAAMGLLAWSPTIGQQAESDHERGREHSIPLFMADGNAEGRQGFIRIINHSDEAGAVEIFGVDDMGVLHGPVELSIGARETKHLNSGDIENGNGDKGLSAGIGTGEGDWRLLLYGGGLDIEPLAYIRTRSDGFLTAMHDVVPDASLRHRVPIFNPGSNFNQKSSLRLINPGNVEANVTITGRDDAPEDVDDEATEAPGEFNLVIPAGGADVVESADLEAAIGDGTGKWSLDVSADVPIVVVNLMSTPTYHLSNLSAANPGYRGATGLWQVTFEDEEGGDGFIILLPDSRMYAWLPEAGEVNRMARGTFEKRPEGIAGSGELYESGMVEVQGLTPVGGSEDFTFAAEYRPGDWIRGQYTAEDGTERAFHGWAFTGFERGGAAAHVAGLWEPLLGDDADLSGDFEPTAGGDLTFSFAAGAVQCNVTGTIGPVNPAFSVYEADVTITCANGLLILLPAVVDVVLAVFDSPDGPGSGNRAIVLAIVHDASKIAFGAEFGL